ncbi:MAG: hypothetical protein ACRD2A_18840, partial [Vicinamibacterales bacterium]
MPKGELLIVDLTSGAASRLPAVKSTQMPARGGAWLAYLKDAPPPPRDAAARSGAADESRSRETNRVEYGTDLVLRDLAHETERTFPDVLEYSFARDGKTLVYAVSSRTIQNNGVYAVTPGTVNEPVALVKGGGRYTRLTWNRAETELAFTTDRGSDSAILTRFSAYRWQRGTPQAQIIVSPSTPGLPATFSVSDRGSLAFSRDGSKVYLPVAPPPRSRPFDWTAPDDRVVVDLWHWQDDVIQPMQRVRANQERGRTYRGVYHLASGKYVQLADPAMRTVTVNDEGSRALGMDDSPYRRLVDYDGQYSDVYLVDTATGQRSLILPKLRGGSGVQWSPDGKFALFYQNKAWHLFDAAARAAREVTSKLGVAVHDEDDDTPDPPGSYGYGGWARDSRSFLIYDRFDVWQVFV